MGPICGGLQGNSLNCGVIDAESSMRASIEMPVIVRRFFAVRWKKCRFHSLQKVRKKRSEMREKFFVFFLAKTSLLNLQMTVSGTKEVSSFGKMCRDRCSQRERTAGWGSYAKEVFQART